MPTFDLKDFVEQPTVEALIDIRKQDWIDLAQYYQITCNPRDRKEVIKNSVIEGLVQMEVLPAEAIDELTPGTSSGTMTPGALANERFGSQLPLEGGIRNPPVLEFPTPSKGESQEPKSDKKPAQVDRFQYSLQMRRMELEAEEKRAQREVQERIKLRELELREMQIKNDLEIKGKELQTQELINKTKNRFKASEATTLLPTFDETNVDGYFRTFESLAGINNWPEDQWLIILYPKFTGKAQRVFNTLEQFDNYQTVKSSIISAYEITPEAYRQKFRGLTKVFAHTFIEFATEKKRLLQKWMDSTNTSTFKELVNLIVLEEVKSKMPQNILRHVEEKGATTWENAAEMADSYAL